MTLQEIQDRLLDTLVTKAISIGFEQLPEEEQAKIVKEVTEGSTYPNPRTAPSDEVAILLGKIAWDLITPPSPSTQDAPQTIKTR